MSEQIMITRTFKAPRELVFRVWTDPQHFQNWWGPRGFKLEVVKMDVRPGGMFLGNQSSPEGHVMWGKFVYHEVDAPSKLVFVNSFCDEEGNTIRAPFSPTWPLEIMNNLTFVDEGDGTTTLTFSGGPINASDEELASFNAMRPMVQQGFGGTFDQLEAYLQSQL
ncbi:SRPBCC domain-containing protein [Paenibacillus koleovorans]|uniref:SRPBCC domain-containing protein n=1 Tax=Paenibacillus koleovorans TaxID=121608 RepID=UPI000FD9114E|nr:SRPBCC domain-containing protein [Paenibacillus koleovorans]